MSVIIGSARIDEHGHATGGKGGDQTGREICTQEFYVSDKGWYVLRPKSVTHAKAIAKKMKTACANDNIGYDQSNRYGVIKYGTSSKTKTEADCSSLVRACVKEATGTDPGDFNTENEAKVLEKTGLFEKHFAYTYKTQLCTGDILVTKTKGHTVVVVKGKSRTPEKLRAAKPTLRKSDNGDEVKMLQRDLDHFGYVGKDAKRLLIDGDFGSNTEHALKNFQKTHSYTSGVVKKKTEPLAVDGVYGKKTYSAMKVALKND